MGAFNGSAMADWEAARQQRLAAQSNRSAAVIDLHYRRYQEAVYKSPTLEAVKVRGTWLPIVPGKTRIPRVGQ